MLLCPRWSSIDSLHIIKYSRLGIPYLLSGRPPPEISNLGIWRSARQLINEGVRPKFLKLLFCLETPLSYFSLLFGFEASARNFRPILFREIRVRGGEERSFRYISAACSQKWISGSEISSPKILKFCISGPKISSFNLRIRALQTEIFGRPRSPRDFGFRKSRVHPKKKIGDPP